MGHSVGLVLVATREWFIRFLHTTKSLGVPGSSRGTLECNRVDLTVYVHRRPFRYSSAILFEIVNKFLCSVLTSSSSSSPSFIQKSMFSVFAISSSTLLTKLLRTASPLGCKSAHLQHRSKTEKKL